MRKFRTNYARSFRSQIVKKAESLIRIAKRIVSGGLEMLQIEFAVSALTKKYTTSTGFKMT